MSKLEKYFLKPTENQVLCNSCGYSGLINTYKASMSMYSDCRCPKCYSTDNAHNEEYLESLQKAWKEKSK